MDVPYEQVAESLTTKNLSTWFDDPKIYEYHVLNNLQRAEALLRTGHYQIAALIDRYYLDCRNLFNHLDRLGNSAAGDVTGVLPDYNLDRAKVIENFEDLEPVVAWTRNQVRGVVNEAIKTVEWVLEDEDTQVHRLVLQPRLPAVIVCQTPSHIGWLPLDLAWVRMPGDECRTKRLQVPPNTAIVTMARQSDEVDEDVIRRFAAKQYPNHPIWHFSSRVAYDAPLITGQFYLAKLAFEQEVSSWTK